MNTYKSLRIFILAGLSITCSELPKQPATVAISTIGGHMSKMRAMQVGRPGGPFEMVEREIPDPGFGAVRIKVQACGVCHSDSLTKEGHYPGISYPRVPGHEVVGVVDAVGAGVAGWTPGQRAGLGWNGGYCGYCDNCRRGNFFGCQTATYITGITSDCGYADYTVARAEALARVPDELSAVEAAPLMCGGITTFNCLRNSGAWRYIDSRAQDPSAELQKLGGAKVVLATVTAGDAMAAVLGGLGVHGTLMVIGAAMSMELAPAQLIGGSHAIKGWYSGTSIDSQDTLAFSVLAGVRSMNEVFPLEQAAEGYERMLSGKTRFRAVLTTGN